MPDTEKVWRLGIIISGRGSNMVALADAVSAGRVPHTEVALVVSDQANALGLERARERGLETIVIERRGRSREDHDREIAAALRERRVDLVCLAGYMRLLSPEFIAAFRNRILNIHPSLLPDFPGLHPHKQALDAGVTSSGCTVHYVDETLDGGPIIAQRRVPVLPEDTEESLAARILKQEHELYAEAVAEVIATAKGGKKVKG
ncbi:MAG TPA: phosphoribosylglycinamide formyltransferase [Pyrinomonadaceae bacterium]|nr:phosphoribosylglycinamide formyltransferase [Pyrinomonadaceae bacterium]